MPASSAHPFADKLLTAIVSLFGGGAIVQTWTQRKSAKSADEEAKLERQADKDEEQARRDFREELSKRIERQSVQLGELEEKHKHCEEMRRADIEKCASDRSADREEMASLRGQVAVLRDSAVYNRPHRRAPLAQKAKARKKA